MTEERLRQLEALCQAATDGPWAYDLGGSLVVALHPVDHHFTAPLATVYEGPHDVANGELMADCRTALPDLLAEVRRLRQVLTLITELDGWIEVATLTDAQDMARTALHGEVTE